MHPPHPTRRGLVPGHFRDQVWVVAKQFVQLTQVTKLGYQTVGIVRIEHVTQQPFKPHIDHPVAQLGLHRLYQGIEIAQLILGAVGHGHVHRQGDAIQHTDRGDQSGGLHVVHGHGVQRTRDLAGSTDRGGVGGVLGHDTSLYTGPHIEHIED